MKKVTERALENSQHILSRAFIDRNRTVPQAILEEKRQIIKEADVTAAYLYDYYVTICQIPSWDLTNDKKIAKQIGLTLRKVADTRRKLAKLGWIRFDTHAYKGVKYGLWYLGKEVVAAKIGHETSLEEFNELGILTEEEYEKLLQVNIDNVLDEDEKEDE